MDSAGSGGGKMETFCDLSNYLTKGITFLNQLATASFPEQDFKINKF